MIMKYFKKNYAGVRMLFVFLSALVMVIMTTSMASAASVRIGSAEGFINAKGGAIIRSSASISAKKVGGAEDNSRVFIKKEVFISKSDPKATNKWYYVYCGNTKGYIRSDLVDNINYHSSPVKLRCDLNVRTGPSTSMSRKAVLKKSKTVEAVLPAYYIGSSDTWYRIRYGSGYMYISGRVKALPNATYIKIDTEKYPEELIEEQSFSIGGVITSNKDIEKVTVKVLNSRGKILLEKSASLSATRYSLASLDKYLKFGSLKAGNYSYIVNVQVAGRTYTKINRTFKITAVKSGDMIAKTALKLAWPEGTHSSKYDYGRLGAGGTDEFNSALDIEFPSHRRWSGGGPSKGASCDVFVGTVVRNSGYDKSFPRGLEQQWPYLKTSDKWQVVKNFNRKADMLRNGDVIIYRKSASGKKLKGHIFIYYNTGGREGYADAGFNDTYGHLNPGKTAVNSKLNKRYIKEIKVYRAVR